MRFNVRFPIISNEISRNGTKISEDVINDYKNQIQDLIENDSLFVFFRDDALATDYFHTNDINDIVAVVNNYILCPEQNELEIWGEFIDTPKGRTIQSILEIDQSRQISMDIICSANLTNNEIKEVNFIGAEMTLK